MGDRPPTRGARLREGLDEDFQEYRDEHQMTDTEALRDLVRTGLEANKEDQDRQPTGLVATLLELASENFTEWVQNFAMFSILTVLLVQFTSNVILNVLGYGFGVIAVLYFFTVSVGAANYIFRFVGSGADTEDADESMEAVRE
jgi:hypothetical protein